MVKVPTFYTCVKIQVLNKYSGKKLKYTFKFFTHSEVEKYKSLWKEKLQERFKKENSLYVCDAKATLGP